MKLNFFLEIELNCDKENHVNFKHMQFSKDVVQLNMCSDLLIDKMCSWKWFQRGFCSKIFAKFAGKYPWRILLLRKVQYVDSQLFWTKHSTKYNLLGIYGIFNITNSKCLDCQIWCQQGIKSFNHPNFDINHLSFFSSYEIVVGKNVRLEIK